MSPTVSFQVLDDVVMKIRCWNRQLSEIRAVGGPEVGGNGWVWKDGGEADVWGWRRTLGWRKVVFKYKLVVV